MCYGMGCLYENSGGGCSWHGLGLAPCPGKDEPEYNGWPWNDEAEDADIPDDVDEYLAAGVCLCEHANEWEEATEDV